MNLGPLVQLGSKVRTRESLIEERLRFNGTMPAVLGLFSATVARRCVGGALHAIQREAEIHLEKGGVPIPPGKPMQQLLSLVILAMVDLGDGFPEAPMEFEGRLPPVNGGPKSQGPNHDEGGGGDGQRP